MVVDFPRREDSWQPYLEKQKIQNGPTITVFFIGIVRVWRKNTLYILTVHCAELGMDYLFIIIL